LTKIYIIFFIAITINFVYILPPIDDRQKYYTKYTFFTCYGKFVTKKLSSLNEDLKIDCTNKNEHINAVAKSDNNNFLRLGAARILLLQKTTIKNAPT